MKRFWIALGIAALMATGSFGYGCSGSSSSGPPPFSPPPQVSPSPTSASTTVPLAANTALPMPGYAGVSGTFTEVNTVTPGTTVLLTTQVTQPNDAPQPLTALRKRLSTVSAALAATASTGTPIVWVRQIYSTSVTFAMFPMTTWNLPPSLFGNGPYELETFDATTGTLIDIEAAGSIGNDQVSFNGSLAPFVVTTGHKYWWELITGFPQPTGSPSPTPTPCGQQSTSALLTGGSQVFTVPTVCGFSATVMASTNDAPANDGLDVTAYVPALTVGIAPPKPGTSTGLLTLSTNVGIETTFNPGMMQFSVTLPASVAATGKSFFISGCTIRGGGTIPACDDNPFIAGPLTVSGQTISYSGLPFSLDLPGPKACGRKRLCDYWYRISVYY